MSDENMLDLSREEFLGAANDHVFEAADNVDIALGIHGSQVSATEPALTIKHFRGLLRHLVVAKHDREAAITKFSAFSHWDNCASHRIDDLDLDMRQRFSNGCCFQLKWIICQRHRDAATALRLP